MSGPTLHEACVTYVRAQRTHGIPEGTIKQYRSVVNRLVARYPGRQFGGIKTSDLDDFLYGDRGILLGKAPKTGTTYRSALRSFFEFGQRKGWTKSTTQVPKPPFRARRSEPELAPTRLTEEELVRMLNRAEHPMLRGMLAVGIHTALRISDIRRRRTVDIDFVTLDLYVWVQKTGRFDAMPVTLDLEEELRRYLNWHRQATGLEPEQIGYLFPGWAPRNHAGTGHLYYIPDPSKPCSYMWASQRLKALFAECGISVEPREAWHVIRRSIARIYFDRLRHEVSHDHALRETAALLGHKNVETTERYLGLQAEVAARNTRMRGRRFISADPVIAGVTALSARAVGK